MSQPVPAARPLPRTISPNDAALHAIAEAREAALHAQTACERLLELALLADTPPEWHPITLTSTEPIKTSHRYGRAKSFGIFNPSTANIYAGIGGITPRAASGAPSVPPGAAIVFPAALQEIELGTDPASVAGGPVMFYLLRFQTVQPFFFGAL